MPPQKPPALPFYVKDWLSSSTRRLMSKPCRSAYLDLLFTCWDQGGVLPNDHEKLRVLADCSKVEWDKYSTQILTNFTEDGHGNIIHKKISFLWREHKAYIKKQIENGRRGGAPKGNHNAKKQGSVDSGLNLNQPKTSSAFASASASALDSNSLPLIEVSSSNENIASNITSRVRENHSNGGHLHFTGTRLRITEEEHSAMSKAFEGIDLEVEYLKMDSWLVTNHRNYRSFGRFANTWIARIRVPYTGGTNGKSRADEADEKNAAKIARAIRERTAGMVPPQRPS